jgi:hypothetical protein
MRTGLVGWHRPPVRPPRTEASLLSLPIRIPLGVAVAAALVASPAQAAPTAVERPSATAFNYTMPGADTALNYTLPGDDVAFHFVRKAG